MDLENQARVKEAVARYNPEDIIVILGGAEAEASGLTAETVTNGDPAFAGPLTGVQLGLRVYHIFEPEVKEAIDPRVYEQQVAMMEMVLDTEAIIEEVRSIREQFTKY